MGGVGSDGHLQVIIMRAIGLAIIDVAKVHGVRVPLEAVDDASEARLLAVFIVGFPHAVGAPVRERLLLELVGIEGVEFDIPVGRHPRELGTRASCFRAPPPKSEQRLKKNSRQSMARREDANGLYAILMMGV